MTKKKKPKITKEDQIKAFKKANREIQLEQGTIKTGPHMTEKDRPRKRVKLEDLNNDY